MDRLAADELAIDRDTPAFDYLDPAAQRPVRRVAITHTLRELGWLERRWRRGSRITVR